MTTIPRERFQIGRHYEWEESGELYCAGFTPQGNAVMVYTEEYGKERGFVIEQHHLEDYAWNDIPTQEAIA